MEANLITEILMKFLLVFVLTAILQYFFSAAGT